jgi:hypothetical protein
MTSATNSKPEHRTLQGQLRTLQIELGRLLRQPGLRPLASGFGTREIDFLGTLSGISQNPDLIVSDFQEPAEHGQNFLMAAFLDTHLARRQQPNQWHVPGKNTDDPFDSPGNDHVDIVLLEDDPLPGHDFNT